MLDDDDLRPLCNVLLRDQVICRLRRILIIALGEVDLISRADDDICHRGHKRVVDLDVLLRAPAVRAVVHVEDDARAMLLRILRGDETRLARRACRECRARDDEDLRVSDVRLIHILWRNREIRHIITVHEDARLRRTLDLRERQPDALAVFRAYHLTRVNVALVEVVQDEITELVIGHAANEADLLAELVDADRHVARRADKVHGERLHLVQRAVQLIRVEVQRHASDQNHVALLVCIKGNECHRSSPYALSFMPKISMCFLTFSYVPSTIASLKSK